MTDEELTPDFEMDSEEGQGLEDQQELELDSAETTEDAVEGVAEESVEAKLEAAEAARIEALRERDGIYARLKTTESKHQRKLESLEGRFEQLNASLNPPRTVEDQLGPEPSKEENPVDWLDYQRRRDSLADSQGRAEEKHKTDLLQQQNQEMEDLTTFGLSSEEEFLGSAGAPDREKYSIGVNALKKQRHEQFMATGMSHQEAIDAVLQDEFHIIARARDTGMNPAEVAWNLVQKSNVQVPEATPAKTSKAKSEIQSMQRGQQAGGLGESPGGGTKGKITMERISKMTEEEFDEFSAKVKESQWEELDVTGKMTL